MTLIQGATTLSQGPELSNNARFASGGPRLGDRERKKKLCVRGGRLRKRSLACFANNDRRIHLHDALGTPWRWWRGLNVIACVCIGLNDMTRLSIRKWEGEVINGHRYVDRRLAVRFCGVANAQIPKRYC